MRFISTNENIQQARKVLKDMKLSEDTPSVKKVMLNIKDIVGDNQGFLGLFTKLYYKDRKWGSGASPMAKLRELKGYLDNNKNLLKDLPEQIVNYDSIEKIHDDINLAREWWSYKKEFVSRLHSSLREEAKKDVDIKNTIIDLDVEERADVYENFLPKTSRYYNKYKEFRTDLLNFIHNNVNIDELIESIENTKGAYLEYNKDKVVVASIFIRKASCEIGSSSWCISGNGGTYWDRYAGLKTGNKQYFIWNLNLAPSNVRSKIGVTINKEGSVYTAHAKDDSHISNFDVLFNEMVNVNLKDVLLPMDIDRDYKKLLESYNYSPGVISMVSKHNPELLINVKDKIPKRWLMLLGLLDDGEIGDSEITDIQRYLYTNNKSDKFKNLIKWCNSIDDEDKDEEDFKNNESYKLLKEMDFKDKVFLVEKYHEKHNYYHSLHPSEDDKDITVLTQAGVECLFQKEQYDQTDFEVSIDRYDVDFTFKMDESEYSDNILNIYDDLYYGLQSLTGYYSVTDDDGEQEYMHHHFDDKTKEIYFSYVNYLKSFQVHTLLRERLGDLITNFQQDEFSNDINTLDTIDDRFSDYITDFRYELSESAEDKVTEDAHRYDSNLMGKYDGERWTVSLGEIFNSFTMELLLEPLTLTDWMESHPNDMSEINFIFEESGSDYPHASAYLSAADSTSANELIRKQLQSVLDGTDDRFDEESYMIHMRMEEYLIKNGFDPIEADAGYRSAWFGYHKYYDSDSGTNGGHGTGSYVIPINTFDVDDQEVTMFTLKKDISDYSGAWNNNLGYSELSVKLIESEPRKDEEPKDYKSIQYKVIKLPIDKEIPKTNQLELDVKESIKSYNAFKQSKLQ